MSGRCHDGQVTRRSTIQFLALSAVWGASYLFIEVALEDVSPAVVVFARTAIGSLVLLPFALRSGALAGLRERLGAVALLALLQIAAPFMLISIGQQEISSSLAGILVATAPIFTFLLAIRFAREERAQGLGLFGVVLGIAGVALLLGVDAGGGSAALIGGLLVVLASFGYAVGAFYFKRHFADRDPIGMVTASMAASALMVAPFAAFAVPDEAPGLAAIGSLTALGALGTGVAFVLFYILIAEIGTTKSSLVAYVAPGFSVIYGVTLLGESFGPTTLAGLTLIIAGSWLPARAACPGGPQAEPARPIQPHSQRSTMADLTIRLSKAEDAFALGRLAQLDDALYNDSQALLPKATESSSWRCRSTEAAPSPTPSATRARSSASSSCDATSWPAPGAGAPASPARCELSAGGVDIAPAREPDRRRQPALLERVRKPRSPRGSSPRRPRRSGCRGSG